MCWQSIFLLTAVASLQAQSPIDPDRIAAGTKRFQVRCAACHGADGNGGERAGGIGHGDRSRLQSDADVRKLIRNGIPDLGMPAFPIADDELDLLTAFVRSRVAPISGIAIKGDAKAGEALFFGRGECGNCHMIHGRGGLDGPDLTGAIGRLTLAEFETALHNPDARRTHGYEVVDAHLRSNGTVRGFLRNESGSDLQIQGLDHRLHFLRMSDVVSLDREPHSYMPKFDAPANVEADLIAFLSSDATPTAPAVTPLPDSISWSQIVSPQAGDWPTYHGSLTGNRHTELSQITPANVAGLAPRWIFPVPNTRGLEVTPVVAGGVMYVTTVNTVHALDARSGRLIWTYSRPRSKGLVGDASGGINRGVAIVGDRVFVVTDNAHLLAIHRLNGALLWDVEMADSHKHYGSTSAPLVVNDLVIAGVSGGDEGIRGFVGAYHADSGSPAWRFWTIPSPGDPVAKTWKGRAIEHGCAATWLTGTYDAETGLLFWPVGNPCPDFNGDERQGDNLYSDSVLALEPATGRLKWHYQFTPHDLHDWDATETPMVVDAMFHGEQRKLLLQGNRNGFFYILDRTNGKVLSATPFVKRLNWATSIGPDGRPVLAQGWLPTVEGTLTCPSMDGATNWMSTAYNPSTGLFYLMALEKCNVFSKNSEWWKQGESFYGGAARRASDSVPRKFLRALDLQTGQIAWQYEQTGPGEAWGGILSTSSGLLFFGDDDGAFTAVDSASGKPTWSFQLNAHWKASPMTYSIDGVQYIAVAAGGSIVAFALRF